MAKGISQRKKAQGSHVDLDQQAINRKRAIANKPADFCFEVDAYMLPVVVLYVWWIVHLEPTSQRGTGAAYYKVQAFDVSKWFVHTTAVPIVIVFALLVLGVSDLKVDSDRLTLLWVLSAGCAGAGVTSLLSLVQQQNPITLLAVAFSFGFAYLHFSAASSFVCAKEASFTSTSPPIAKTEAVLARMVLLADTVGLGGFIAIRVLTGLASGDVFSLPIGLITCVGLFALICLRTSATSCVHQLRHVLSAGFVICISLFFSTMEFVADWNTGIIRLVAIGGLVAHLLCFVTSPLLRIYQYKWNRFKRFVKNYNPGEAYTTE